MAGTITEMQLVQTNKLVPYVNNARTHSPEQIMKLRSSIREFGFLNPVIIDRAYNLVAGHGRIMAAKEEGIDTVPCVFVDNLTEAQKKAYIIADNRMAMDAGWDEELLRIEIEALQAEAFDIGLTGFEEQEIADLFGSDEDKVEDDDFDLNEALEKAAFVKRGDVWQVGRHRLMCGDATSEEDVATLMDGKQCGLCVTDPPYGVSFEGSNGLKIKNDSMTGEKFEEFLLKAFSNMHRSMSEDASIYVFHSDSQALPFYKAFDEAGFYMSQACIWKKQSLTLGRKPYQVIHEPIIFGWKKKGKHRWFADRKQVTVWEFDKPRKNGIHPTMKPLDLLAYPIQNSSLGSCIVLDLFGGSGSTLMACEQTDRICHTMELDEKYASVILRRYVEDTDDADNVYVIRDGERIPYSALVVEVEGNDE